LPESTVGEGWVSPFGIVIAALVLAGGAVVAFLLLIQVWPSASLRSTNAVHDLMGIRVTLSRDDDLLLVTALAGALGGFLHSLRSLAWYVGNGDLRKRWLLFLGLLPLVGGLLATIVYLVLRGGLVSGQNATSVVDPYGVAALAALSGLFSSEAVEKLRDVFGTLLSRAASGADHTPPKPADEKQP
jgi:hypothetical protein